ncbi:MAG: hypothetical protein ABEI98_02755, partial [Halorhabdus sp.]
PRTVVVLGVATALFSALGTLEAITSFASLAFVVVFGGMGYLALNESERDTIHPIPPALALVGSAAFLPLMLWNLFRRTPETLVLVLIVGATVVGVELLYFERETLVAEVEELREHVSAPPGSASEESRP